MLQTRSVQLTANEESTPSVLIVISEAEGFPGNRATVFLRNTGEGPIHIGAEEDSTPVLLFSIGAGETLKLDVSSETTILGRGAVTSGSGPTTGSDRSVRVLAVSVRGSSYNVEAV